MAAPPLPDRHSRSPHHPRADRGLEGPGLAPAPVLSGSSPAPGPRRRTRVSVPQPAPFLMVTRLTQGFILVVDGQEAIACSNSRSLVTTIRGVLGRVDLDALQPTAPRRP